MATAKSSAKTTLDKRPAPVPSVTPAKKGKPVTTAKPAVKTKAAVKAKAPAKTKTTTKAAAAKPAPSVTKKVAKKPAGIPPEQRRNYVEVAAYHIAERRGFGPGNLLEDWVQAEAEIDRLLAEGRLGG